MTSVSVHEAKTHLSRLLREIEAGREIEITRRSRVVARIVPPVPPKKKPLLGAMSGRVKFDESFYDALPDEFLGWPGDKG